MRTDAALIAEALLGASGLARPDGPYARGLNSEIVGPSRVHAMRLERASDVMWVLPLLTRGYSYVGGPLLQVSEF